MTALRSVPPPDHEASRLARMAERRGRLAAVEAMPEGEGKTMLVKFGLALRFDLPLARVRSLLNEAPDINTADKVGDWLDTIPSRPSLKEVR